MDCILTSHPYSARCLRTSPSPPTSTAARCSLTSTSPPITTAEYLSCNMLGIRTKFSLLDCHKLLSQMTTQQSLKEISNMKIYLFKTMKTNMYKRDLFQNSECGSVSPACLLLSCTVFSCVKLHYLELTSCHIYTNCVKFFLAIRP